jgi:segregation and condensation protein B
MLETLAIIAYRQPITRPEIEDIRGVDCGGVLRILLDRGLIRIMGKKEEVGRPLLYGSTKQFLEFFHLKDLKELPTLKEFTELSEEHADKVDSEFADRLSPPRPADEGAGEEGFEGVEGDDQEGQQKPSLVEVSRADPETLAAEEAADAAALEALDQAMERAQSVLRGPQEKPVQGSVEVADDAGGEKTPAVKRARSEEQADEAAAKTVDRVVGTDDESHRATEPMQDMPDEDAAEQGPTMDSGLDTVNGDEKEKEPSR